MLGQDLQTGNIIYIPNINSSSGMMTYYERHDILNINDRNTWVTVTGEFPNSIIFLTLTDQTNNSRKIGIRKKGSTLDTTINTKMYTTFLTTQCDSNGEFEIYISSSSIITYITGYYTFS